MQSNNNKRKSLNKLWRESGKKVPFKVFAAQYNEQQQPAQSLGTETAIQPSSTKDYSGLQLLAVIGIAIGIVYLLNKD